MKMFYANLLMISFLLLGFVAVVILEKLTPYHLIVRTFYKVSYFKVNKMYMKDRIFPKIQNLDIFEDQVTNCGQNHYNVGEISRFQRSQRQHIETIVMQWNLHITDTCGTNAIVRCKERWRCHLFQYCI